MEKNVLIKFIFLHVNAEMTNVSYILCYAYDS
jgi:hypothetical protein